MIFLKRRALMTRASFNYKTVSGIGSITLENCVETRFKRLSLSGNSVQTTTKGLQLLDKTKIPTPQAGVAYYNMQVEEGKYTLSTKYRRAVQKDLFLFAGEVDTGASSGINGVDSTISRTVESINGYITIGYRKGENGVNPFDFETMLNKGDTPLPYEPYTGGKPSPSVEYPQEIKSAGKLNADTGKYDIDVQVIRNLFNHTKAKSGWIATSDGKQSLVALGDSDNVVSDYIRVNPGMIYTPSVGVYKYFYDSEKNFLKYETLSSSIIIPNNVKYMIVIVPVNRAIVIQAAKKLIIYESDSEQQTLQLQLDEPLRGIGEYKDVITKDGILRKIKEIVLDENTGFEIYWATLNKTFAFISPTIKDATVINFTPNRLLCNYFKALPDSFDRTDEEVCVLFNRRFHMRFFKERNIDTVEKLKEWLKQNPIKIQYLLQEPILEPLENSLENLHANDGTTVITVDSGEVETGIEVEYAVKE